MCVYIFGNGNLSVADFLVYYQQPILCFLEQSNHKVSFILGDFRGVDTLCMELLKTITTNVTIFHIGERPRYFPDQYKTKVSGWKRKGGYVSDAERDEAMIAACTHYLGVDFNSNEKRKSGTKKNIESCEKLGKIAIHHAD